MLSTISEDRLARRHEERNVIGIPRSARDFEKLLRITMLDEWLKKRTA